MLRKQNVNNCDKTKTKKRKQFILKFPSKPQHLTSHDNASHTLKPVNNIPNPTKNPRYATTCTPTRGNNTGVCSIDRPQLTPHTPKKVPQKRPLVQQGGMVIVITANSAVGGEARGAVRYPADKSNIMPRERNIDATRSKQNTNTGTHCNSDHSSTINDRYQ